MRKRFEQQNKLDSVAIPSVEINTRSRHELPQLLAGLQYIFVTPSLNESVFSILSEKIMSGKQATGREGMSLWEIFVFGSVRLNLDINYDMLHDLGNNHMELRGILGVYRTGSFDTGKHYALSTIKENVRLLDEQTLKKISDVVVGAGHDLKKKEMGVSTLGLHLKTDTYAVESNIHFPTDLNLLWDCLRSCIRILLLIELVGCLKLGGWRAAKSWVKKGKRLNRIASGIHRKKGKKYKERLVEATEDYLKCCRSISEKLDGTHIKLMELCKTNPLIAPLCKQLVHYHSLLNKHIDLVDRRILMGQTIPHEEKLFSIFEPHVEWLQKGKANNKVELGHKVLVTTDQFHFIVDHIVVVKQVDKELVKPLLERLEKQFEKTLYELLSISSDKGFYTKLGKDAAAKVFDRVVIPKKGKKTAKQEVEESSADFVSLRHAHSAVESNINELEHSGVNKVPDKTLGGFKRYVALGVVAYNIKRLGRIVIAKKLLPTLKLKGVQRKKAA